MAVKRPVGRPPKAKAVRPNDIKFAPPKNPTAYKAKRLFWVLLQYEKKMAVDIESVKLTDYFAVLDRYEEILKELKKVGIEYGSYAKKARERMVKQGVVQDEHADGKADDSRDEQTGVGAGVPPADPFA